MKKRFPNLVKDSGQANEDNWLFLSRSTNNFMIVVKVRRNLAVLLIKPEFSGFDSRKILGRDSAGCTGDGERS